MLEKQKGIIAAYPHGDSKMVHIRASKEGALSKESFTKLIQSDRRFKVESFTTRSLMKKGKKGVKPVTMK